MTTHNAILVTGATGNVGPHVVRQLADADADVRVLVLDGDPVAVELPAGVETFHGDLADPDSLDACLDGVAAVLFMWPFFSLNVGTAPAVLDKIEKQAQRIVFVSSIGVHLGLEARDNNCHAYLEELIEKTGLAWTFLQTTGFAANAKLSWAGQIRADGTVRSPYGTAARSPIHEADVAAVAVRALTTDDHVGAKLVITGPQALMQVEQLNIIGEAIGRPLRWEEIPAEDALEQMVAAGWPPAYAAGALDYFAMLVTEPELVTSVVEEVLGTPARRFQDWAVEHADDFC
jgi:uncharacterized protein YbjT (DUF2867 family)